MKTLKFLSVSVIAIAGLMAFSLSASAAAPVAEIDYTTGKIDVSTSAEKVTVFYQVGAKPNVKGGWDSTLAADSTKKVSLDFSSLALKGGKVHFVVDPTKPGVKTGTGRDEVYDDISSVEIKKPAKLTRTDLEAFTFDYATSKVTIPAGYSYKMSLNAWTPITSTNTFDFSKFTNGGSLQVKKTPTKADPGSLVSTIKIPKAPAAPKIVYDYKTDTLVGATTKMEVCLDTTATTQTWKVVPAPTDGTKIIFKRADASKAESGVYTFKAGEASKIGFRIAAVVPKKTISGIVTIPDYVKDLAAAPLAAAVGLNYLTDSIKPTNLMEYRIGEPVTAATDINLKKVAPGKWVTGSETKVVSLSAALDYLKDTEKINVYVRFKAVAPVKSEGTPAVPPSTEYKLALAVRPAATATKYSGAAGTLPVGATEEYSLDRGKKWTTGSSTALVVENDSALEYWVRTKGVATSGSEKFAGTTQKIIIAAPAAAPAPAFDAATRKITGVSKIHEYKKSSATSWIAVGDSDLTIAAGDDAATFSIRIKGTDGVHPSKIKTIVVPVKPTSSSSSST